MSSFDNAIFNKIAFFRRAIFQADVNFECAVFQEGAGFYHAAFNGIARFYRSKFCDLTGFDCACFEKTAEFTRALFSNETRFVESEFIGNVVFDEARFGMTADGKTIKGGELLFEKSVFHGFTDFTHARFGQRVHFYGARFAQSVNFRNACFFATFPQISGALLHPNTVFSADDAYWPDALDYLDSNQGPGSVAELKAAQESLATIRNHVAKQGLPEDEHYFFRREMAFASKIGGLRKTLPYKLFGWLSNFGYSIARPAGGLVGLWAGFGVGYLGAFYQATGDGNATLCEALWQGFGLSFANIFAFLGFHNRFAQGFFDDAPWGLILASGTQTVFGFILLFFLGLGLRTRFRLR